MQINIHASLTTHSKMYSQLNVKIFERVVHVETCCSFFSTVSFSKNFTAHVIGKNFLCSRFFFNGTFYRCDLMLPKKKKIHIESSWSTNDESDGRKNVSPEPRHISLNLFTFLMINTHTLAYLLFFRGLTVWFLKNTEIPKRKEIE